MSHNSHYRIERFNGDNFTLWKARIQQQLMAEGLHGVVFPNVLNPVDADKAVQFRNEQKACGIIQLALTDVVCQSLPPFATAAELWKELEEKYSTDTLANIYLLKRQLLTLKYTEGTKMEDFFHTLESLQNKLAATKHQESDMTLIVILQMALPAQYNSLMSSLEVANVTTYSLVKKAILSEWQKRKLADSDNPTALFVKNKGHKVKSNNNSQSDTRNFSTPRSPAPVHYNNARNSPKHTGGNQPSGSGTRPSCTNCGKMGHTVDQCYALKRNNNPKAQGNSTAMMLSGSALSATKDDGWVVDSGATNHIANNKNSFNEFRDIIPMPIRLANNTTVNALATGTVNLQLRSPSGIELVTLHDVLYIPEIHVNLLSVKASAKKGVNFTFADSRCTITSASGVVLSDIQLSNDLYRLPVVVPTAFSVSTANTYGKWHNILGHIPIKRVSEVATLYSLPISGDPAQQHFCDACVKGKMTKAPRHASGTRVSSAATKPLELIHSDVCGPMSVRSLSGSAYMVTFIDDATKYTHVSFLRDKGQVLSKFKEFVAMATNKFSPEGYTVQTLRTDNGGEYTSNAFRDYLALKGIIHEFTPPYTPHFNGVAERMNRTIVEMARSILLHSTLPTTFWAEAINFALHVVNRLPLTRLGKSPYQLWHKGDPTMLNLHVFGCKAFMLLPKQFRGKFDAKAVACIYLGPQSDSVHRLYNLTTQKVITSRDVSFDDNTVTGLAPVNESEPDHVLIPSFGSSTHHDTTTARIHVPAAPAPAVVPDGHDDALHPIPGSPLFDPDIILPLASHRHSNRLPKPPARLTYSEPGGVNLPRFNSPPVTDPPSPEDSDEERPPHGRVCLSMTTPVTYKQAVSSPDAQLWLQAIEAEHNSLINNGTWTLVDLPSGRKPIGAKWVFKVKTDANGNVDKYKARLVAKGYSQVDGIDYSETFAPVVKMTSIRLLLAIAAAYDMELHQMDVDAAFLNGFLDEDIYMVQPEGFVDSNSPNKVCKLIKSIYGLKQAGRVWYETIAQHLMANSFTRCASDSCIFYSHEGANKVIIAVYVDDLIIAASNLELCFQTKKLLSDRFSIKDLGKASYILGIKIERSDQGISLNQTKYALELLTKQSMLDCNSGPTPITPSDINMIAEQGGEIQDVLPYKSFVGSVNYMAVGTRPDLAYVVGILCRYMDKPTGTHWNIVNKVLRYLKGTPDIGITFNARKELHLIGYSDSDWAGDKFDRKSTTGYCFMLNGSPICWSSKKQLTVALSSTEAEYMALTQATKEAIWIRAMLKELGFEQTSPTLIYEDNKGCLDLARNPIHHARTKHIDVQHHFVREKIISKEVELASCSTDDMIADVFTKALTADKFIKFRNLLNMK